MGCDTLNWLSWGSVVVCISGEAGDIARIPYIGKRPPNHQVKEAECGVLPDETLDVRGWNLLVCHHRSQLEGIQTLIRFLEILRIESRYKIQWVESLLGARTQKSSKGYKSYQ